VAAYGEIPMAAVSHGETPARARRQALQTSPDRKPTRSATSGSSAVAARDESPGAVSGPVYLPRRVTSHHLQGDLLAEGVLRP
jgi:hypothetical protein